MNSSDPHTELPACPPGELPRYSGRVLMGCDSAGPGFVTIQEIEGKRHRPTWDEATEVEYIGRCKQKAETLAREIINQAMQRAQVEAQTIRDTAQPRWPPPWPRPGQRPRPRPRFAWTPK